MRRSHSSLPNWFLLATLSVLGCSGDALTPPQTPPTTGTLQIQTSTQGSAPDLDGYIVKVDGAEHGSLAATGSMSVPGLTPGDHVVELGGLASTCSVAGDNPRSIGVAAGQIATETFAVTCGASTGSLEITSNTSGSSPNAGGYTVIVDGEAQGTLGRTGKVNVGGLAPGAHIVGLSGVAANCQVDAANPRTVAVAAGSATTVAFAATCVASPSPAGILRVTTTTTGVDLDPDGYIFAVDGIATQPIGVNGTATVANVAAGSHAVHVSGLAPNCNVQGDDLQFVTVPVGATGSASFAASCSDTGDGSTPPIIFAAGEEIFAVKPDGTGLKRLTHQWFVRPSWAPDGSKIATIEAGSGVLDIMNADGSGLKTLFSFSDKPGHGVAGVMDYHWSPLGDVLAVEVEVNSGTQQEHREIWTVRADGSDAHKLVDYGVSAIWSPNGREIGFLIGQFYVIGADGTGLRKLTNETFGMYDAAWAPDGGAIAYSVFRNADGDRYTTGRDIVLIKPDGTGRVNLTNGGGDNGGPVWSPDGSRIVFTSFADALGTAPQVEVINRDGSGRANLSGSATSDFDPVWSPDGTMLLFRRGTGDALGNNDIYVMNADGNGQRNLTNTPNDFNSHPDWRR
jgi:Tol biopolymer transport system component